MDVQKEINELRRKLNYYGKLYYVDDAPAISDYEYDMLMQPGRGPSGGLSLSGCPPGSLP
mgnify:CR=1 FL=1